MCSFFFSSVLFKAGQSGAYFDYFLKKLSEIFLRNVFVCMSQFFAEKYIIEYLSKKLIESFVYYMLKGMSKRSLSYDSFFFLLVVTLIVAYISVLSYFII